MRINSDMNKKVISILSIGMPIFGKDLAKKCGLKVSSIYRIIRIIRKNHIGIIPTKNGYLLAEHAEKKDDVFFLRKLNGRRASDYIALNNCIDEIQKRWKGIEQKQLRQIIEPLYTSQESLTISLSILNKKSKTLGL